MAKRQEQKYKLVQQYNVQCDAQARTVTKRCSAKAS